MHSAGSERTVGELIDEQTRKQRGRKAHQVQRTPSCRSGHRRDHPDPSPPPNLPRQLRELRRTDYFEGRRTPRIRESIDKDVGIHQGKCHQSSEPSSRKKHTETFTSKTTTNRYRRRSSTTIITTTGLKHMIIFLLSISRNNCYILVG